MMPYTCLPVKVLMYYVGHTASSTTVSLLGEKIDRHARIATELNENDEQ
jgi:hypothetical protein